MQQQLLFLLLHFYYYYSCRHFHVVLGNPTLCESVWVFRQRFRTEEILSKPLAQTPELSDMPIIQQVGSSDFGLLIPYSNFFFPWAHGRGYVWAFQLMEALSQSLKLAEELLSGRGSQVSLVSQVTSVQSFHGEPDQNCHTS